GRLRPRTAGFPRRAAVRAPPPRPRGPLGPCPHPPGTAPPRGRSRLGPARGGNRPSEKVRAVPPPARGPDRGASPGDEPARPTAAAVRRLPGGAGVPGFLQRGRRLPDGAPPGGLSRLLT